MFWYYCNTVKKKNNTHIIFIYAYDDVLKDKLRKDAFNKWKRCGHWRRCIAFHLTLKYSMKNEKLD